MVSEIFCRLFLQVINDGHVSWVSSKGSFLIAWKVLLEGLSTSNAHSLWPIRIDIFAVLMKNGCLTKLTFLLSMKKSTFRSAFLNPRVLIGLILCAAAAEIKVCVLL